MGAFNLSLILRQLMGAGKPREWKKSRGVMLFGYSLLARHEGPVWFYSSRISMFRVNYSATARSRTLRCRTTYLHHALLGSPVLLPVYSSNDHKPKKWMSHFSGIVGFTYY